MCVCILYLFTCLGVCFNSVPLLLSASGLFISLTLSLFLLSHPLLAIPGCVFGLSVMLSEDYYTFTASHLVCVPVYLSVVFISLYQPVYIRISFLAIPVLSIYLFFKVIRGEFQIDTFILTQSMPFTLSSIPVT